MFEFNRMHDNFWGGSMLFSGILWMILLVVLIVVLVFIFMKLSGSSSNTGSDKDSSMSILKERYARGEITEEEYDQRRKKLKED
ncbi:SHOCT domain-containing protein [Alkalicoccus saliphilus]|jgi:putative membrane protein|nr:SHOCT domain-containing protein [Alkalicoccus saliphilus]